MDAVGSATLMCPKQSVFLLSHVGRPSGFFLWKLISEELGV